MRKQVILVCIALLWWNFYMPGASAANYQSSTYVLEGKVIVLDAGHGGSDSGAIGSGKITEKEVTLPIALELRKLLTKQGATVLMTRTKDKDVAYPGASDKTELQARVNVANHVDADLFISIHADAFITSEAKGTTTYFYDKSSSDERFAKSVQRSLVKSTGLYDRGALKNDFYVLKQTTMPAVLAEVGFISNLQEAKLLQTTSFTRKAAQGIFDGISSYFAH